MRGGALQVGGTARGRRCLCQGDGVCLLFTVEGPEEGCGGRKKTSKDGSAITGLCAATNHSCHVNRPLKRPIFLPLKNWNVPVITWHNFPPLPLPPVFLSFRVIDHPTDLSYFHRDELMKI